MWGIAGEEDEQIELKSDEEIDGEAQRGIRRPGKKLGPKEPTEQERKEHCLKQLPFHSWCRHCIRGRGKEAACRKVQESVEIPEVHVDFMFMGEEAAGEKTLVMLVAKERGSKAVMCSVVPRKTTGEFISKRVVAFMREVGCEMNAITIKSDNEPALVALVDDVVRVRASRGACKTNVEHSPVYSSKSNGVIERGVQTVQGMIRTLRSALEERWQIELQTEHAVWCWLAEYAGWLVNRAEVGHDGKSAYERNKGKKAKVPGLEFGEGVLWKRKRMGGPLGKLTCMWKD